MATGKGKAAAEKPAATEKPASRRALVADLPEQPVQHIEVDESDVVTAHVPKGFNLTLDSGHTIRINAGTQEMPREHAEHYYAKANGVTIKP